MMIDGIGPTYPEAGVMATKPQTAPTAIPTADGFFFLTQSGSIQPSREVDDPQRLEEAADAPVPVRDRHVDERRPEDDVDQEGLEPDPLSEGADDQGGRDCGELQLEREVQEFRDRVGVSEVRSRPDVVQSEVVQAPDERIEGRTEGERVPPQGPDQADDCEDGEALGDRRDEILPPDKPAVEEAQSGRHDHDEGGGRDDPSDVPGVQRQIPRSTELDGRQGTEPGV